MLFNYSWWVCSFLAPFECHNIPVLISFMCGLGPSLAQVQLSHRACPSSSSSLIHSDVTIQCLWNIAMAVSQTSLTLHHGVNQAREGYKRESYYLYTGIIGISKDENPHGKCSLDVLCITFGYSPVVLRAAGELPSCSPDSPTQPFFREFVKKWKNNWLK